MKLFLRSLAVLAVLVLAPIAAHAQTASQQSATSLTAATLVATSATSAATLTLSPPAGQYVYVENVEITNCAGAAAVTAAAVTTVTTTNLGGSAWTVGSGATAGLCQPSPANGSFSGGLKSSAPGTAVTVVLPTFATNQTIRVSLYYYFAP